MRTTLTTIYPADPFKTAQMLADPGFHETRFERFNLPDLSIDVTPQGAGFAATVSAPVPTNRLPAIAAKFIKGAASAQVTETWSEPSDDGSRTGTLTVDIQGAPVTISGSMTLRPALQGTERTDTIDLTVKVPIIGKKIEQTALDRVSALIADEERRAAKWLA